jgi:hypothetical protein
LDFFSTRESASSPFWQGIWNPAGLEAAMRNPGASQQAKLFEILARNAETPYGAEHQFASLRSISSFQREVPINTDERLRPYIQRGLEPGQPPQLTAERPLMYALSGGAGGTPRVLPITRAFIDDYLAPAQMHAARLLSDHPSQSSGKLLSWWGNDVAGLMPDGTPYGALSGFLARRQPARIKRSSALPAELASITDLEQKYYLALRLALEQDISAILIPHTGILCQLAEGMERWGDELIADIRAGSLNRRYHLAPALRGAVIPTLRPNPRRAGELAELQRANNGILLPRLVWPKLAVISCWKSGTLALAYQRLARLYGPVPVREHGYISAEVWGSVPLSDSQQGGALAVSSAFFEFLPEAALDRLESATTLTCDQLEVGHTYGPVVTTTAGLYRFLTSDLIRVVDFYHDTPVVAFDRHREHICSLAGEKLREPQVTAALLLASSRAGVELAQATAAPQATTPGYVFTLECAETLSSERFQRLGEEIESALQGQNGDYARLRHSGALAAPVVRRAAPGAFGRYLQEQVSAGAPDDQIVLPHLTPDRRFSDSLAVMEESQ